MSGPSAYCGGLFLASLQVMKEVSGIMNDNESVVKYESILEKGKQSFQDKLWNGQYYLFDLSGTKTIMRYEKYTFGKNISKKINSLAINCVVIGT
jgi:uncharacterized protein (DUF608 family)